MPTISVYKPLGWTPLDVLNWLRKTRKEWHGKPMSYAGRLDPMAEGLLLVLVGEDRFKKPEMIQLDKTYCSEILLGIETDSYDVLGIVKSMQSTDHLDPEELKEHVRHCAGKQELPFPPFSAYKVHGAPLHYWAREGKLDQIEIPTKVMSVDSLEYLGHKVLSRHEIKKDVLERIQKVRGAFRQEQTETAWREVLAQAQERFLVLQVRCQVGSGTYIRALAHKFGQDLGTGAILWSLKRESVGEFGLEDCLRIEDDRDTVAQSNQ